MTDFSNRKIFYNSLYNIAGKILPLFIAVITVPIFINRIGIERFGILTISWAIIGYFGIFDIGLSCATTKYAAEYLALNKYNDLRTLVRTSFFLLAIFGLFAGVLFLLFTPFLINNVFKISPQLIGEAKVSFYLLAISIPFVFTTACMQGIMEAKQCFALINAIRVPASIANYIGPLPVLLYTNNLIPIIALTIFLRLVVWFAFIIIVFRSLEMWKYLGFPSFSYMKLIFSFGGWVTVSNVISPLMVSIDRFIIGAIFSMEAVSYYSVPSDLVGKLFIIPSSLMPVLFPAFSALGVGSRGKLVNLFRRAVKYIFLSISPVIIILIILAYPILDLWLGQRFAENSAFILQIMALGVLINSLARVPYSTVQALGRPDLTAKLHILEAPFYFFFLWFLIRIFGLPGVAWAWVFRVSLDAVLLFYWAHRLMPEFNYKDLYDNSALIMGVAFLSFGVCLSAILLNLMVKLASLIFMMVFLVVWAWRYLLDEGEKAKGYLVKNEIMKFIGF